MTELGKSKIAETIKWLEGMDPNEDVEVCQNGQLADHSYPEPTIWKAGELLAMWKSTQEQLAQRTPVDEST